MQKISVIALLFLTSCATILNGKNQKITIKSHNKESDVLLNHKVIARDSIVTTKIKVERKVHVIACKTPGFETQQKCIMPYKNTASFKLSCFLLIPSCGFFYTIDKYYEKDKEFPRLVSFPAPTKISYSPSSLKSIDINEMIINDNSTIYRYNYTRYMKNKVKLFSEIKDKYKTKIDLSSMLSLKESSEKIIHSGLVKELIQYGYADSNLVLRNNRNMLSATPTVNVISSCVLEQKVEAGGDIIAYLKSKATISWEVKDYIGNVIYSYITEEISDDFPLNDGNSSDYLFKNKADNMLTYYRAVENCLQKSLHKLLNDSEINNYRTLENSTTTVEEMETFEIKQTNKVQAISELDLAIVKIVVGDMLGSGTFIGEDGEIITSAVFCQNMKDLKVITSDKIEYVAELLHIDNNNNLALLKIDHTSPKVVELCNEELKLANTIFAGGLSSKDATNSSLSKGIVSAIRIVDGSQSIQISSKLSSCYLGGPLVNIDGKLVGILNFKIVGNSVEGLGFATPIKYLNEWIQIK